MKRPSFLSSSTISQPIARNYLHVNHSHHATIQEITDRITKSVDKLFENEPRVSADEKENNASKWITHHQSCLKSNIVHHAAPTRVKQECSIIDQTNKGPLNEVSETSDSESDFSIDDFLTFTKEDILDFDEDWDILMSKNTVQTLLDSLKTNQRTEVMSDLNMWISSKSTGVQADLLALNQIEQETQKKGQELNEFQAAIESQLDNKELQLFQVLHRFYKVLHELAHPSKGTNEETKDHNVNRRLSSHINTKQLQNIKIEPISVDEKPIWRHSVVANLPHVRQHPTAFLKSLSAHQDRVVNLSSKVEANGKTIQMLQSALKYLQNPSTGIDPPDSDTLKLIESIKSKHVQEKAEAPKDVEQTNDEQLVTDLQQPTTEENELQLQRENFKKSSRSVSLEKPSKQKTEAANPKFKKQMKNYKKLIWTAENTLMIVNEQKKHFLESVERAKQVVAQKDSLLSDAAQNEEKRVLPHKVEFEKAQQEQQTDLIANLAINAMTNNNEKEANATSNEQSVSQGTNSNNEKEPLSGTPEENEELEQLKIENMALTLKIKQLKEQLMKGQEEQEGRNKEEVIKKKKPKHEKRKHPKESKRILRQKERGKKTKQEELRQEGGKKTKQEELRQEGEKKTKQEETKKEENTTVENTTVENTPVQCDVADITQPSLIDGLSKLPPLAYLNSANIPPYAKRLLRLKKQNAKLKQQIEYIDEKIRALNVKSNNTQLDRNSTTTTEQTLAEKHKVTKKIKRKEKELIELRRIWWTEKQEAKGQNTRQINISNHRQSLGINSDLKKK